MPVDAASTTLHGVSATGVGAWHAVLGPASLQQRLGLRRPGSGRREDESPVAAVARSAFWLFVAGASLVLLSLLFDGGPYRDQQAVAAIALVGFPFALVCLVGFDRLPAWAY